MTSVLITGAGGLIGRRVVFAARHAGYDVTALVRRPGSESDVTVVQHDLRLALPDLPPVDWLFHLAGAYAGAGEAELQRADLAMAENLLRWGISAGIKNWIFASAAEVYGDIDGYATEESPTKSVIPYGRVKLQIEQLFTERLREIDGHRLVILRIGEVYGSDSKLLTELTARLQRGFCPWPGSGKVPVSFVHVDDVAAAFLCAARMSPTGTTLFNIVDDAGVTWRDFLTAVAHRCATREPQFLPLALVKGYAEISTLGSRLLGRDPVLTAHALRLICTPKLLSNARAKRELGFRPHYPSYSEGLEEALRGLPHHTENGAAQARASG